MKTILKNIVMLSSTVLLLVSVSPRVFSQQPVIEWKAPAKTDTIKNPLTYNEESIKKGKTTFTQLCVPCHGDKGKGDGVASAALNPKPGNLISAKVQAQKDGAIFWKLTNGKGAMVSYDLILTKEQRWQLVNYIRSLAKTETKK